MARPEHGIAAQIRNIEQAYGKPVSAWIDLVTASRLSRHPDIVAMLKTEHGMTHGAAHRVALLARDASKPPPADPAGALYAGRKAALRPIHDKLIQVVSELGDDVEQAPKKGYISLRRARAIRDDPALGRRPRRCRPHPQGHRAGRPTRIRPRIQPPVHPPCPHPLNRRHRH